MSIAAALLAEYEQEANSTREFLQRVPEDQLGWKPHEKSMSLGQLALHLATNGTIAEFVVPDQFEFPEDTSFADPESRAEILEAFDENLGKVRSILGAMTDDKILGNWQLTIKGNKALEMPRIAMLRSFLCNHWYHHRGQLSVYLRMLNVEVPSAYGPTADVVPEFMEA